MSLRRLAWRHASRDRPVRAGTCRRDLAGDDAGRHLKTLCVRTRDRVRRRQPTAPRAGSPIAIRAGSPNKTTATLPNRLARAPPLSQRALAPGSGRRPWRRSKHRRHRPPTRAGYRRDAGSRTPSCTRRDGGGSTSTGGPGRASISAGMWVALPCHRFQRRKKAVVP
jgi:hypothetical protein